MSCLHGGRKLFASSSSRFPASLAPSRPDELGLRLDAPVADGRPCSLRRRMPQVSMKAGDLNRWALAPRDASPDEWQL